MSTPSFPSPPRVAGALAASLLMLTVAACEEPFYDDDIGLTGVPVEPGALVGTFAQKNLAATVVRLPIPGIGEETGGGFQWLLLERSYDEASRTYAQRSKLCGGRNIEVHGTVADAPQSTYRAVPDSLNEVVTVGHGTGQHDATGLVQLWGIRDLDDPANDPFPSSREEAAGPAFADKVYDMDEDGEQGYTTTMSGFANGKAFGILRRKNSTRGVVLGPDRIVGLVDTHYDSFIFGADDAMVESMMGGETPRHPDPKESWFEELRVASETDCDGVMELESSETFTQLRPF